MCCSLGLKEWNKTNNLKKGKFFHNVPLLRVHCKCLVIQKDLTYNIFILFFDRPFIDGRQELEHLVAGLRKSYNLGQTSLGQFLQDTDDQDSIEPTAAGSAEIG